jgi:hypothetical protein
VLPLTRGAVADALAVIGARRYEGRMIDLAKFLSRVLMVASLVALAGCAGGSNSADLAPAAPQPAASQPPPGSPPNRTPSRSTQITGPVMQTPEKVKTECWMKYEGEKKINIDQRLALVEKCIDETTRNQPPQRN